MRNYAQIENIYFLSCLSQVSTVMGLYGGGRKEFN